MKKSFLYIVFTILLCGLFSVSGCGAPPKEEEKIIPPVPYEGMTVSVKDMGAKGDGSTDDSEAVQNAATSLMQSGGGVLYFPAGNYVLGKQIKVSQSKLTFATKGDGVGITNILVNNADGFCDIKASDRASQVTVSGLSILAKAEGVDNAFKYTMPEGGNRHNRSLMIEDVCVANDGGYFKNGLVCTGQWRTLIQRVTVIGGDNENCKVGIQTDGTYAPKVQNSRVEGWESGITMVSEQKIAPEDMCFEAVSFLNCKVGLKVSTPGIEPQMVVQNCVFDCYNRGMWICGKKFNQIVNCTFYYTLGDDNNYTDVYLENCFGTIVSNNIFKGDGAYRRAIELTGGQTRETLVHGNIFDIAGTAVISNVSSNIVRNNIFSDTVSKQVTGDYTE